MSYVRKKKILKLVFEDPEMSGLVVRAKSVPLGQLLKLMKLADLDTENLTTEDLGLVDEVLSLFARSLVDWNLENEDEEGVRTPVPATYEGVQEQDLDFVINIVSAWVEAMAGVSAPLPKRSDSGATFPEGSLPMVALSGSRAS